MSGASITAARALKVVSDRDSRSTRFMFRGRISSVDVWASVSEVRISPRWLKDTIRAPSVPKVRLWVDRSSSVVSDKLI